jgi:hypothetical protein
MAVFWFVALCILVEVYQRFRGTCCFHHQGDEQAARAAYSSPWTLRQKTLQSTQLIFYKTMAVPMLTYANENWSINRSDKKRIVSRNEVPTSSSWIYSPRSKTKYRHTFRIKNIQFICKKKKVKLSRYTPCRHTGGEEVQLLLILNLGTKWGWVVSVTPRPRFTPGERTPGTHWTGGWVGPRAGLDAGARIQFIWENRKAKRKLS